MENGQHFWATMNDLLAMMCKTESGYYVCGNWEGIIKEDEFVFIENVERPKGYENSQLAYE